MTTPTLEALTAEEVDDNIRRLGVIRAELDAVYRDTQDRLQNIGADRAAVEDAILIAAAHGRLLRETALVPLRTGEVVKAGQVIGSTSSTGNSRGSHVRFETRPAAPLSIAEALRLGNDGASW